MRAAVRTSLISTSTSIHCFSSVPVYSGRHRVCERESEDESVPAPSQRVPCRCALSRRNRVSRSSYLSAGGRSAGNEVRTTLHCTALHCTALYCTALYCTALYCTLLYCTALHCTTPHCTTPQCSSLDLTTPHSVAVLYLYKSYDLAVAITLRDA